MIKKVWHKIKELYIPDRWVAVCSILALIVILLPILRLAMYATPWYDDYSYTALTKGWMIQDGTWISCFKGAYLTVRTWWNCWQGTYSSIFLMALSPLSFGEKYYWIGIVAIIIFFAFSTMLLVKVVFKHVLKAKINVQIMVASLVTATLIEFIYSAQQGLFWYNSAVHYTFMHGMFFLLIAVLVKIFYAEGKKAILGWISVATFLAFVCAGSNFVSALQGFLSIGLAFLLMLATKKKSGFALLLPIVVYAGGLYMSISAPGNAFRSANYQGMGAVEAVIQSFVAALQYLWEFTRPQFFVVLLLYILLVWNTVKEVKFSFKLPGVITLLSFCFYATGFTSSFYGMGMAGLARTWVAVKFTLLILLFFNATYWVGWGMNVWRKKGRIVGAAKHYVWCYALAFVGILLCFFFTEGQARDFSTFGAYYYVHTGEAANHLSEYEERVETIKNSGEHVEVKPMFWKPWFLFKGELSTNPYAEENVEMAKWYGKQSITLIIEDEAN